MAEIWKGAPVAAAIAERLQEKTKRLKEKGIEPCLALVRVGEREDDIAYEQSAIRRCAAVGIRVQEVHLPADAQQGLLMDMIRRLNRDPMIHGVLIFRPLPAHLDDGAVRAALLPEKDVDGITDGSLAGVFSGTKQGYPPCTAQACMEILDYYKYDPKGKRAVVVGRSLVVGRPAAMLLLERHATVTICHTRTVDLPARCREADILIVAAGKAGALGADCFAPGQVVLDVGIHVKEDGGMCGDVDFEAAQAVVGAITPVPGGVGTVTTSVLAAHVIEAAGRKEDGA